MITKNQFKAFIDLILKSDEELDYKVLQMSHYHKLSYRSLIEYLCFYIKISHCLASAEEVFELAEREILIRQLKLDLEQSTANIQELNKDLQNEVTKRLEVMQKNTQLQHQVMLLKNTVERYKILNVEV